jgi:hypothetical protein
MQRDCAVMRIPIIAASIDFAADSRTAVLGCDAMKAVVVSLGLCLGASLGLGCQKGVSAEAIAAGNASAPVALAATAPPATMPPAQAARAPAAATVHATAPSTATAPPAATGTAADPPASPAPAEPARITLPKSPGTRVRRTAKPLTRKQLERLSVIEHADFERQERGLTEDAAEFRHTTMARPKLGVTIKIETCTVVARPAKGRRPAKRIKPAASDPRACTPMKLARWQAREDELKQHLSKDLVDRPDTRFEIGTRKIAGVPTIFTYQLGHFFGKDDRDQPVGAYSDAYILYYNDGVNRIQVIASYLDDAVSRDQLLALAPREDLEKLAVAFASYYLHAWK